MLVGEAYASLIDWRWQCRQLPDHFIPVQTALLVRFQQHNRQLLHPLRGMIIRLIG